MGQETEKRKVVFVTVGTTLFEALITAVTQPQVLTWLSQQGYTDLILQYGQGSRPVLADYVMASASPESSSTSTTTSSSWSSILPLNITAYDFKPSLQEDMQLADLLISHAGAGTVMEALRMGKRLVVVINTRLMHNHQTELAQAMGHRGHLFVVQTPEQVARAETWQAWSQFVPQPYHAAGTDRDFPILLNEFMGFSAAAATHHHHHHPNETTAETNPVKEE